MQFNNLQVIIPLSSFSQEYQHVEPQLRHWFSIPNMIKHLAIFCYTLTASFSLIILSLILIGGYTSLDFLRYQRSTIVFWLEEKVGAL
jgi:hypothetical protein